ncbi:hypothetical protein [Mesoterricola silvestris]|uniref:Uncharacterized protein n=1 Tax=Mesoterricola silvestris TaxID=2927979 RepID=A0AA48H148_9BACT|nr:hypothetical protein [Mesoterricola silvestris]BDU74113.1 hypothetical protein METEAL_32870 [Mesoterricola silvestris]
MKTSGRRLRHLVSAITLAAASTLAQAGDTPFTTYRTISLVNGSKPVVITLKGDFKGEIQIGTPERDSKVLKTLAKAGDSYTFGLLGAPRSNDRSTFRITFSFPSSIMNPDYKVPMEFTSGGKLTKPFTFSAMVNKKVLVLKPDDKSLPLDKASMFYKGEALWIRDTSGDGDPIVSFQ